MLCSLYLSQQSELFLSTFFLPMAIEKSFPCGLIMFIWTIFWYKSNKHIEYWFLLIVLPKTNTFITNGILNESNMILIKKYKNLFTNPNLFRIWINSFTTANFRTWWFYLCGCTTAHFTIILTSQTFLFAFIFFCRIIQKKSSSVISNDWKYTEEYKARILAPIHFIHFSVMILIENLYK